MEATLGFTKRPSLFWPFYHTAECGVHLNLLIPFYLGYALGVPT